MNQRQIELFRRAVDFQIALYESTYELDLELGGERLDEIFAAVSGFGTIFDDGDDIPNKEIRKAITDIQRAKIKSNPAG